MKFLLIIIFLSALSAHGQRRDSIGAAIHNTPTPRHVQIPTTKLHMIPPEGFRLSEKFPGFELDEETVVEVEETFTETYAQQDVGRIKATAISQGVKILEHRHLKIGHLSGQYLMLQLSSAVKGYMLLFGDHKGCVKISAFFPAWKSFVETAIIQSINSIVYMGHH